MTTDLVARLRGIIDAKPPHVTVLADNEEVYPIRVELLREAADYIDWVKQWGDDWRKKYVEAEARLAAQQTILSTLEGERRRLTERLAAAERVVGRVRTLRMWAGLPVNDERVIAAWEEVRRELNGYEKAYSSKPTTASWYVAADHVDCRSIFGGEYVSEYWGQHAHPTDLNTAKQADRD